MTDGFQLAGYTVTQILRESATELALLGYQQALNKRCFIRAVRAPASLGFWQTEVDVLNQIASPKLLQLIDHGQQGGWHYSAVEYVSQGRLTDLLQQGLSLKQLMRMIKAVAVGLQHLHEAGFVHHALSTERIFMRSDGTAVLTGYQWCSQLGCEHPESKLLLERFARSGLCSPEVLRGQPSQSASDYFSLGVVLYQALVGQQPFAGDSETEIYEQITQQPLPALPQQFAFMRPVLEKLLAANPSQRIASYDELVTHLAQLSSEQDWSSIMLRNEDIAGQEVRALGGNLLITDGDGRPSKRTLRRKRRQRRTAVGFVAVLTLSLAFGLSYFIQPTQVLSIDVLAASLGLGEDPELVAAWDEAQSLRQDPNQGLTTIVAAYQRVLALDPDYEPAREAMATLMTEWKQAISSALVNDNTELAATRLDEATALLSNDPEINLLSLQLQNRYRAERLLKSTEALLTSHGLSDSPSAAAAIQSYQEILRLAPNHPGAIEGLNTLARHYVDLSKRAANDGKVAQAIRYLERATAANQSLRSLDDARELISKATTLKAAIDALLQQGSDLLGAGALVRPKGENSAERFQQVLATDPDNSAALQAMLEISQQVLSQGQQLLDTGKLAAVDELLSDAASVGVSDNVVEQLRTGVTNERQRLQTVAELLAQGLELFNNGLLTEPSKSNAVMVLRNVQQLDPGNATAQKLLQRCAQRLVEVAVEARRFGFLADADQYLALALSIQSDSPEWIELQRQWQSS